MDIVEVVQPRTGTFPKGLTWLILGEAKVGKTTFGLNFADDKEKVLLLDLENGAKGFPYTKRINVISLLAATRPKLDASGNEVLDTNGKKIMQLVPPDERGFYRDGKPAPAASMMEAIAYIRKNPGSYETVVLDTVDDLNSFAEQVVMEEKNTVAMGDANEFGKDWAASKIKVIKTLKLLQEICQKNEINLIILSHVKTVTNKDSESDQQISSLAPDLPSGLRKQVTALADVIAYAYMTKNGDRLMSTRTGGQNVTGTRYVEIADAVFNLSYSEIKDRFAKYHEKKTPTLKPETTI